MSLEPAFWGIVRSAWRVSFWDSRAAHGCRPASTGHCETMESVRRVAILGPGGAGKSILAVRLGSVVGIPVLELDGRFWNAALEPMPLEQWRAVQIQLAGQPEWIMDGDLGPYDVVEPRLRRADTVIVLDFARWRCARRSLRRSRERLEFWWWLWSWPNRSRPQLLEQVAALAGHAELVVLRSPSAVDRWMATVASRNT
jgi:hypothetical protein